MQFLLYLFGAIVLVFGLVVLRGAPYVPTHRKQIRRAFTELYPLKADDVVVDLGSGDGVVLVEAEAHGAQGIGYELNPILVFVANLRLRRTGSRSYIKDYLALQSVPFGTTVVYAFTTGHSIDAIHKKMLQWSKLQELYFISYGFEVADKKAVKSVGPMRLYHYPKA